MFATPSLYLRRWIVTGVLVCFAVINAPGASVGLAPVADTSILSGDPFNSMGAVEAMVVGLTQNYTTNRSLMRFDVAGAIPAGSKIQGATFYISVNRQAVDELKHSFFGLRRMLRDWGEGTNYWSEEIGPGHGTPASPGDATWHSRFFGTNNWASPGGAEGTDFSENITSTTYLDSLGVFEFEGTPQMIEDIQSWLDQPGTNFGWMLKSESEDREEGLNAAAKRIASREDPDNAPQLAITYIAPPQISTPRITNGAVEFSFAADAGGIYVVEGRTALGGTDTWSSVTNFGFVLEQTNIVASIATNSTPRFFRVRVD